MLDYLFLLEIINKIIIFWCSTEAEIGLLACRYLNIDELVAEGIIWVDEANGLHNATCYIVGCKVVGVDCEWKPNYEKGTKPNKVVMALS